MTNQRAYWLFLEYSEKLQNLPEISSRNGEQGSVKCRSGERIELYNDFILPSPVLSLKELGKILFVQDLHLEAFPGYHVGNWLEGDSVFRKTHKRFDNFGKDDGGVREGERNHGMPLKTALHSLHYP